MTEERYIFLLIIYNFFLCFFATICFLYSSELYLLASFVTFMLFKMWHLGLFLFLNGFCCRKSPSIISLIVIFSCLNTSNHASCSHQFFTLTLELHLFNYASPGQSQAWRRRRTLLIGCCDSKGAGLRVSVEFSPRVWVLKHRDSSCVALNEQRFPAKSTTTPGIRERSARGL